MDETTTGKRMEREGPKGRLPLIVAAVAVAVLLAAYLGLCGYVSASQTILPHVSVAGVEVGGMSLTQAQAALDDQVAQVQDALAVTLRCGSWEGTLDAAGVQADTELAAQDALACGREHSLAQGFQLLRHALGGSGEAELTVTLNPQGEAALTALLTDAQDALSDGVVQADWRVEGDTLILTPGVPGRTIDLEQSRADILAALTERLNALLAGEEGTAEAIPLSAQETAPDPVDLQAVYDAVVTQPQDARFDPDTRTVVPHVTGLSFDLEAAQAMLDAAGEGEELSIPLTLTEPELTTQQLEASLFADLLGECTTTVDGTANRVSNVALSAQHCNDTILLPGEVFSYNTVVGPRTTETGFKPAPAYVQGQTVDEVGGGICQTSSTLYLATLRANLEIVERQNHSYISSYITAGMDATVSYGALDYRFKNNTAYPIRIEAGVTNRQLTIRIYGTKTDDVTVKMTYEILSTTPYGVVYKADSSVPAGTTKVSVTPYTGYKVVTYRNLYNGSGTLISSTQEAVSTYKTRDKVILYNPADGDPSAPAASPSPSPAPTESTTPAENTTPAESASPEPSAPADATQPADGGTDDGGGADQEGAL